MREKKDQLALTVETLKAETSAEGSVLGSSSSFLDEEFERESKLEENEPSKSEAKGSAAPEGDQFPSGQWQIRSIVESVLFASDRPLSVSDLKKIFEGRVKIAELRKAIEALRLDYQSPERGFYLEEVAGGLQLRSKVENQEFLVKSLGKRIFRLSDPAMEVLAIVAYQQPIIKSQIDEIRGVESGHLLRMLIEKDLVTILGKSELPGRPLEYATTKKFLEIFSLRSIKDLPSLTQIEELLPEGMDEELATTQGKPNLSIVTDDLTVSVKESYSQSEEELEKITSFLKGIEIKPVDLNTQEEPGTQIKSDV
jgi:segregation and condensation protein B